MSTKVQQPQPFLLIKPPTVCRVLGVTYPTLANDVVMRRFPPTDVDGGWFATPQLLALIEELKVRPRQKASPRRGKVVVPTAADNTPDFERGFVAS